MNRVRIIAFNLVAFLLILSSMSAVNAFGQTDTLATGKPMTQEDINMVMSVFDGLLPYEIIGKADGFIMTGKSDEEIAQIAYYIYRYYRESRIMGYDEIAIYVADNYFLNGKYKLPDEEARLEMRLFADANRRSLIGMRAPVLTMQDPAGNDIRFPEGEQDYSILYFYDDECPACQRMTPTLMQYLSRSDEDINFTVYMVYTQDDRERWMDYVAKVVHPFDLPDNVSLFNLWDPEMSSDFLTAYGVISTPKLFLVDRNGVIIGRELTPTALSQVVELNESQMTATEELFEQIFLPMANTADTTEIVETIDMFFEDSKDNPDFFHEIFYELYQYLKSSPSYTLQQGAAYLANKYIAGMPELWETVEFTNKGVSHGSVIRADYRSVKEFIDQTALAVLMFYRNPLDKQATDLTLRTLKNKKQSIYDLRARYTVLYFYDMNCALCSAVSDAIDKIQRRYDASDVCVAAIYTGKDNKWKRYVKESDRAWIDLWDRKRESGMFDKYDLMDVPAIYLLDENKVTLAKDINPDVLSALLEYYLTAEEQ